MKKKLQLDAFDDDSNAGANDYGNENDNNFNPGFGTTRYEMKSRSQTMHHGPLSSTNRMKKQKERFNKKMNQIDKMEIN